MLVVLIQNLRAVKVSGRNRKNRPQVSHRKRSRLLSLILRHKPETVGLTLDENGWVEVSELLAALSRNGTPLTRRELERVVSENDKKRFAFSPDGSKIRASQGHSVTVDLDLREAHPPELLYHGTVEKFLASILQKGLLPGGRHHVHLSQDRSTAFKVGSRRGNAIILEVHARQMKEDGHRFFLSDNGVWLTDSVPVEYLTAPC